MKTFAMTLTAAGMVLGSALPVLAQDTMIDAETLTCAQFMALGAEDQARAVTELHAANTAAGAATGTSSETTGEAQTDSSAAEADTATDKSSSTDDTAADVATGTTSATGGADADVTALQTACTGQDAMLAKDVMVI